MGSATIVDGELVYNGTDTSTKKTSTKPGGELGKDEFLQLLVTQMAYQDPLDPQDNSQMIAQLAQFTALEQMQNLNQSYSKSQAFSLVGKDVIVQTKSEVTGKVTEVEGYVDYVSVVGSKTYLYIDGERYNIDDLSAVIGDRYYASLRVPQVKEASLTFDHNDPKDLTVDITLGEDGYEASKVAVGINGEAIDAEKYLQYDHKTGKLTIKAEALRSLDAGTYKVEFLFDDPLLTSYTDKVTVKVTGEKPPVTEDDGDGGKTDETDKSQYVDLTKDA